MSTLRSLPLAATLCLLGACAADRSSEAGPASPVTPAPDRQVLHPPRAWKPNEVARVLGRSIVSGDPDRDDAYREISQALVDDYASSHGITASEDDIKACAAVLQSWEGDGDAQNGAAPGADPVDEEFDKLVRALALTARLDEALYAEFGGTVYFYTFPPQSPAMAYSRYFAQRQAAGDVEFREQGFAQEYFAWHSVSGTEVPLQHIRPDFKWWLQKPSAGSQICRPRPD